MNKYFSTLEQLSKEIDKVLEAERKIKKLLPIHPRWSNERIVLDNHIKNTRWLKKKFLQEYREARQNPEIKP
jgi:hypothetical protein